MWRFLIELFTEKCYGYFVEGAETPDGIPCGSDPSVAKNFQSAEELNQWVKENTTLDYKKEEYGIKGIYYHNYNKRFNEGLLK